MRILIVTGDMNEGGAQSHVYELAENLMRRGHFVCVASAGGFYADKLRHRGAAVLQINSNCHSPIHLADSFLLLYKAVTVKKFDVIHAHTRISAFLCDMVAKKTNTPFVTTVHAKFRMDAPFRRLSRYGQKTIAVGEDLKAHVLKNSSDVLSDNVFVIPNGVDTVRFSPSKERQMGREIVFVSRLDGDCSAAAYALCRIAPRLDKVFSDLHISIVGGGGELEKISAAAAVVNKRAGRKNISVVGGVGDTSKYLKKADVFVGVSRAAIEAMCCGVRVVLAGNEGFGGVVDRENIGALSLGNFCARECSKTTDKALLCAIAELLRETGVQRCERERFFRSYALKFHSSYRMAVLTEEVYRTAVFTRSPRGSGVLLCGYYGCGNVGDDALLCASISRAHRCFPALGVQALTAKGTADNRKFGIKCVARQKPLSVIRAINASRVVVFGGGTLLQNSSSHRSLWYYIFLIYYAKACGKRVLLWGNGIDPIRGKLSRKAVCGALKKCDYIGVRDSRSLLLACSMAGCKKVHPEQDLASKTLPASPTRIDYILRGVGVRCGAPFAVAVFRGGENLCQTALMYRHLKRLCKIGILPIIAVMCENEDLCLSKNVCHRLHGVLLRGLGAQDIVGVMSRAEVVLGMRYHALVFAKAANVPAIPYGTQPKIKSMRDEGMRGCEDAGTRGRVFKLF